MSVGRTTIVDYLRETARAMETDPDKRWAAVGDWLEDVADRLRLSPVGHPRRRDTYLAVDVARTYREGDKP